MNNINAYLTTKNNTFYVVITYYIENKRKIKWVSTKIKETDANRKKAEKKLIQIRDEFIKDLDTIISTKTEDKNIKITFADYMIKWLDMKKYQIQESTYAGYKRLIHGRIFEYFNKNNILLTDLKPVHILDFYTYLYSQGLNGTTVNHYHASIRTALEYACKTDLILSNPANKIDKPKISQFITSPYNEEELNNLFKIIKNTNIELIIYLTTFYGLRKSEVLGLKWDAIDFDNKTITIKHTVTKGINDDENSKTKTKLIIKDKTKNKNKSSYRTLPLIEDIESLLLHKKKMIEYYKSLFKDSYIKTYKDYVCVNEMEDLFKPDYTGKRFLHLLKQNDLRPIRFHDLRHSCATLLVKKGISTTVKYKNG